MRDGWLDEHVGGEAALRPEFEAQLGETLQSAWRKPASSVMPRRPSGPSRRAQVFIWSTAAAVLLIGGVVVVTQTGKSTVTSNTSDVTLPATSVVLPETSTVPTGVTTVPIEPIATTSLPPTSLPTTVPPTVVATSAEQQTVLDYLTALAEERYDAAAKVLGEGGLSLEDRSDLRPFLNADGQIPDLADSLKAWCQAALCQQPTALSDEDRRVLATFAANGVERTFAFTPGSFEGQVSVRGLPPQLPAGASLADTVQCGTRIDPVYADLDGDGWYELVAVSPTSGEGLHLAACGTNLATVPLLWQATDDDDTSSPGLLVLDVEGDGTDELLLGLHHPDDFRGELVLLRDSNLAFTGLTVVQSNVVGSGMGNSYGCVDFNGDGVRELVNYTFRFIGGFDISTSSALEFTATSPAGGDTAQTDQFDLPAEQEAAFRLIAGYCGNFPTLTG